jgi:glucosamine 6-phosphate synthetase-like amidotransferase/phosphosugar isomerase protein
MCGIIGFLGSAPNHVVTVLNSMAALIYRAPDSTGLGGFGDDLEPMRVHRSLGAVDSLVRSLDDRAGSGQAGLLAWVAGGGRADPEALQARLAAWEGLPAAGRPALEPPAWEDLTDEGPQGRVLRPGDAGRAGPLPPVTVSDQDSLVALLERMTAELNLSPVLTKALVRQALDAGLEQGLAGRGGGPEPAEVAAAFEWLFEELLELDPAERQGLRPREWIVHQSPAALEAVWEVLAGSPVRIPQELDSDGVRRLFWLLDAALLSRLPSDPALAERLESRLAWLWPGEPGRPAPSWRRLYWAEREANLYGRAAAAGLGWLAVESFRGRFPRTEEEGLTAPRLLAALSPPVLGHGRWALQSPVAEENAHPFSDEARQRAVVLNGQFDATTEDEVRRFLEQAGHRFRSRNSTEYLPLLWAHYYRELAESRARYQAIERHVAAGLQDYALTSSNIDYHVFARVRRRQARELDQEAFLRAVRALAGGGGQLAAAGISQVSPRTLLVAMSDRPVFVVWREDHPGVMVVSDVNAALGLFPQPLVQKRARRLAELAARRERQAAELERADDREGAARLRRELAQEEADILAELKVRVLPLKGEEACARVELADGEDGLRPEVEVTDFDGEPLPEITPFDSLLNPLWVKRDVNKSFYRTHLEELPERLEDALGAHLPEGAEAPRLDLRTRVLARRFGPELASLRRVVLVAMGSSYNAALLARAWCERLLPGLKVAVLRPLEAEDPTRAVDPERDLVVLLNWSGTSADMVQFAQALAAHRALMVGVTEKPFSDLGLIAQKSAGVVGTLSGEEVTFTAVKSGVCLVLATWLLAAWLAERRGRLEPAGPVLSHLRQLPYWLTLVIADQGLEGRAGDLAAWGAHAPSWVVLDDLAAGGAGYEVAQKLEEACWSALGKVLDYSEAPAAARLSARAGARVVVLAGRAASRAAARQAMAELAGAGVEFAAVVPSGAFDQGELGAGALWVELPAGPEGLQPLLELAFSHLLAMRCELLLGRWEPGFPRNRAKSVTVARSRRPRPSSLRQSLATLERTAADCAGIGPADLGRATPWERAAAGPEEAEFYAGLKELAAGLQSPEPEEELFARLAADWRALGEGMFSEEGPEGEVLLACLDRPALAAAEAASGFWSRLVTGPLRVVDARHLEALNGQEAPVVLVSSRPFAQGAGEDLWRRLEAPALWVGPEPGPEPGEGRGVGLLRAPGPGTSRPRLAAGLHLALAPALESAHPGRGSQLRTILAAAGQAAAGVLGHQRLWELIHRAAAENAGYYSGVFVGPAGGCGRLWAQRLAAGGRLTLAHALLGEGPYGHLVAVDPDVAAKFVALEDRAAMEARYGAQMVARWEEEHLGGRPLEELLQQAGGPGGGRSAPGEGAFFAEGAWRLPVLKPGYDASRDSLVLVDATHPGTRGQALDALGGLAWRYARLAVVCQETDLAAQGEAFPFPIGHLLALPGLPGREGPVPVPGCLLFLLHEMVARALAAALEEHSRSAARP